MIVIYLYKKKAMKLAEPEIGFGKELEDGTKLYTNCTTGGPLFVYVKDGKIVRLEPIHFSQDDAESWSIEARGRIFFPPRMAMVSPYALAERPRIYSPKVA